MSAGRILRRGAMQGARWRPDPAGTFAGYQVVGHRAGIFSQGAVVPSRDSDDNWIGNDRRSHNAKWPYELVADVTNMRTLWLNDVNDMDASLALNASNASAGITQPDVQARLGLFDGTNLDALDLRAFDDPATSLGDGTSPEITVPVHEGIFGVPPAARAGVKGATVNARIFAKQLVSAVTGARFPIQGTQNTSDDPGTLGASQASTTTSYAHSSEATWSGLGYGGLGVLMPSLLGLPIEPLANVWNVGDSVDNGSLDITSVPDWNRGYNFRAMTELQAAGHEVAMWNSAQGNETLQTFKARLENSASVLNWLLRSGVWSHVLLGHGRNDIQDGRAADDIIDDFEAVIAYIREHTPAHTKVYLTTLPPYTYDRAGTGGTPNTVRNNAIWQAVLDWQLGGATGADLVIDTGAAVASDSDRAKWATPTLGDSVDYLGDGIHPPGDNGTNDDGHEAMKDLLVADPTIWTLA